MNDGKAIEQLEEFLVIDDWSAVYMPYLQDAIEYVINRIKALEERPKGKWELIANDTVNLEYIYKCSECGREVRVYNASALTDIYPYCHCGADMRGEEE